MADTFEEQLRKLTDQKNAAYAERNRVVALLARMALALEWRAGGSLHPSADTTWEPDWRTIVFIELPTGQVSWHFHDSERWMLIGLPRYEGAWDGHSTAQKYERCAAAVVRDLGKHSAKTAQRLARVLLLLQDLKIWGLRCDLTPTMTEHVLDSRTAMRREAFWQDYIAAADKRVRAFAEDALRLGTS